MFLEKIFYSDRSKKLGFFLKKGGGGNARKSTHIIFLRTGPIQPEPAIARVEGIPI